MSQRWVNLALRCRAERSRPTHRQPPTRERSVAQIRLSVYEDEIQLVGGVDGLEAGLPIASAFATLWLQRITPLDSWVSRPYIGTACGTHGPWRWSWRKP